MIQAPPKSTMEQPKVTVQILEDIGLFDESIVNDEYSIRCKAWSFVLSPSSLMSNFKDSDSSSSSELEVGQQCKAVMFSI